MDEKNQEKVLKLLKEVAWVKMAQEKPTFSNQGQCMDGFSALANFNAVARKILYFLEENKETIKKGEVCGTY